MAFFPSAIAAVETTATITLIARIFLKENFWYSFGTNNDMIAVASEKSVICNENVPLNICKLFETGV